MKFLRGVLAATPVLLLAAAPRPASDDIDISRLRARVSYLASPELAGRASGSEGGEKAARFIADAFSRAGLLPLGTRDLRNASAPLDAGGFFEPFLFAAGVEEGANNRLAAVVGGKSTNYRAGTEFEPAGISSSGPAKGPVVFGGYGIVSKDPDRDDYAGLDVKGKIVLLLAGYPGNDPASALAEFGGIHHKVVFARERGAAAVIVAAPTDRDLPGLTNPADHGDEGIPVFLVRRAIAADWMATGGHAIETVEVSLAHGPLAFDTGVMAEISADVRPVRKVSANVAAWMPGDDPKLKDEFVVIGAHFDHLGMGGPSSLAESSEPAVHPGADDNASGTAGVMALADLFAAKVPHTRRSLVFLAFSGEEKGLLGSDYYVKHPLRPLASTVAMVNMDMIGRFHDNKLAVIGTGSSPFWAPLVDEENRTFRFKIAKEDDAFGASDQQSFYTAKIPVLFFFTGVHKDYHRPSDTADKINYEGEARVLGFVADIVEKIADADSRPAYREAAPSGSPRATSFKIYFGSIPDYATEADGVALAGVRDGSPAAKAGLKGGDVIIRFGGLAVRNINDYTVAFSTHRPGDVVEVVVRRDGKDLTFTATLEAPRR